MKQNGKVTCRPCKEQNNWEIETPNGVMSKHYASKDQCVKAGRKYATEYGCDLVVSQQKLTGLKSNTKKTTSNKNSK